MLPLDKTIENCRNKECIVSPVLTVNASTTALQRPVTIKLPLLCKPDRYFDGEIVILKQNDDRSEWKNVTRQLHPALDTTRGVVAFEVTSFSL